MYKFYPYVLVSSILNAFYTELNGFVKLCTFSNLNYKQSQSLSQYCFEYCIYIVNVARLNLYSDIVAQHTHRVVAEATKIHHAGDLKHRPFYLSLYVN